MAELSIDKKFKVLSDITRAQHFAWHAAVRSLFPQADPTQATLRMWEITGEQTARAYLKRIDPTAPLAKQVAESIAWSSQCMGEEAHAEPGTSDAEAYVRHRACPWLDWHRRLELVHEDRPGCDRWFESMVRTINAELGSSLQVETLETLPEGCSSCLRRLWTEDDEI